MRHIKELKGQLSLRLKLTLWYVSLLAITILIFSGYVYWRLRHTLMWQVDNSLRVVATQILLDLDITKNEVSFKHSGGMNAIADELRKMHLIVRLVSSTGKVLAGLGYYKEVPLKVPKIPGYTSVSKDERVWRVYNFPIKDRSNNIIGWLQTIQSLDSLSHALEELREQFYWGIPLALIMAGLGGFFLANRALKPIDQITQTAYSITATDLSRRINYRGPKDEVGRLADTFDAMLNRLQEAFERERRFTDDAAHELRTPLTILKGKIGVTLSKRRSTSEYEKTLKELEQEVDRLIRLSTDLLFLSRLGQEKFQWQWENIDLSDLLHVIAEQVMPMAKEKGVRLVKSIDSNLHVNGDRDHLIRLFLNLLDNALKYTPKGGEIRLSAKERNKSISVAIADSGPGIPEEALPHIFERFYRVDSDRSRETGGTGLGLTIAYEIVRQHGGSIEVKSKVGKGTTFIVTFPKGMV